MCDRSPRLEFLQYAHACRFLYARGYNRLGDAAAGFLLQVTDERICQCICIDVIGSGGDLLAKRFDAGAFLQ